MLEGEGKWVDAGQGGEGREGMLQLQGGRRSRRVIVLRGSVGATVGPVAGNQQLLNWPGGTVATPEYEYAVLVTSLKDGVLTVAQLYRDRGDAENNFDELKNQWGWAGFTTRDLYRCQVMARHIALIYNWWSLFVRVAAPRLRRDQLTSR